MSNERHDTIDDIVEMLRANARGDRFDDFSFTSLADRIESARKREREARADAAQICGEIGEMVGREEARHKPVTDCHGLNAAAMREALMEASIALSSATHHHMTEDDAKDCLAVIETALSAPPRNCDKYTLAESLRKYGFPTKSKPWGEKEWIDFCEWYISEAKGGVK